MHIQFAELPVRDQARAKEFYVKNLGCAVAANAPMGSDGWRWIELKFSGAETTLHFIRATKEDASDGPVLVLVCDDVASAVEDLRKKGVEILTEPHSPPWQPGRTVAEFRDSEGNRMVIGSR
ncbi:VOC family protein [Ramlibacter sp.]|uniref:VOC family protein n=1 Tax=Ramlibacter sp. TaxID=1917967 RepID=UPI0017F3B321|nr:VOC family protein [Ramlibacter sp.]MBA2673719.1 VOC family protein [Ramlibacter sp.]